MTFHLPLRYHERNRFHQSVKFLTRLGHSACPTWFSLFHVILPM